MSVPVTSLAGELGIKAGSRARSTSPPEDLHALLGDVPDVVRCHAGEDAGLDVIVLFTDVRAELKRRFPRLAEKLPRVP